MRFLYTPYEVEPTTADPIGVTFRPRLKVRVIGIRKPRRELSIDGLLDTGAEVCVLPSDIAAFVGVGKPVGGGRIAGYAGEDRDVPYRQVKLQIHLGHRRVRWTAIVAFDEVRTDAVWGWSGFQEYFRITFDGPARHFTIRLPGPLPAGFEEERSPRRKYRSGPVAPIAPDDQDP